MGGRARGSSGTAGVMVVRGLAVRTPARPAPAPPGCPRRRRIPPGSGRPVDRLPRQQPRHGAGARRQARGPHRRAGDVRSRRPPAHQPRQDDPRERPHRPDGERAVRQQGREHVLRGGSRRAAGRPDPLGCPGRRAEQQDPPGERLGEQEPPQPEGAERRPVPPGGGLPRDRAVRRGQAEQPEHGRERGQAPGDGTGAPQRERDGRGRERDHEREPARGVAARRRQPADEPERRGHPAQPRERGHGHGHGGSAGRGRHGGHGPEQRERARRQEPRRRRGGQPAPERRAVGGSSSGSPEGADASAASRPIRVRGSSAPASTVPGSSSTAALAARRAPRRSLSVPRCSGCGATAASIARHSSSGRSRRRRPSSGSRVPTRRAVEAGVRPRTGFTPDSASKRTRPRA
jgi:hypothetical protein